MTNFSLIPTPQEAFAKFQDELKKAHTKHNRALKEFKKDPTSVIYDPSVPFIWEVESRRFHVDDNTCDVHGMLEEIQEFMKTVKPFENYTAFRCEYECEAEGDYNESAYISKNEIEASWKVPREEIKEESFEIYARKIVKDEIEKLLKPASASYARSIDCKFMTLWKEEKIDWETLQQIVYSDCKL